MTLFRLLVIGTLFVGGLATLGTFRPGWVSDLGLDLWNVPTFCQTIQDSRKVQSSLEQQQRIARRTHEAKLALCRDLIDGRRSILEVGREFRELHAEHRWFAVQVEYGFRGRNLDERICRCVIRFAVEDALVEADPATAERVRQTLEAQLEGSVDSDGLVHLPT